MAHIHWYMNNPTAGGTDGTEISSGTGLSPLTFNLNASEEEVSAQKVALRCDSGYSIEGSCSVYFAGTTSSLWSAALDNSYTDTAVALSTADWQSSLTLSNVTTVNSVFWIKAASSSLEGSQNDTSVVIHADGVVVATNG